MKLIIGLFLSVFVCSAFAGNDSLRCKDGIDELSLERVSMEGLVSLEAEMNYNSEGGWGYYGARCQEIEQSENTIRLQCSIEPEFNYYIVTSEIELSRDMSYAIHHTAVRDGRYRKGYRLEDARKMSCKPL